ncbi:hypothetical protein TREPR_2178 [Treponema primitia ZAS-2]|uniref:Uncharacterized protein n=1 Tax=Treponema primitia (strain ATCC BAA-887 / DSM 12427 / ZAS-2) TaxID=545694 RepID=F5YJ26_TREPZ|nr:hypothetical protein [Treponema primitia]AEF86527.1 hypothetical protein TREPR_2178 [Treponema primitia ZAS-2]
MKKLFYVVLFAVIGFSIYAQEVTIDMRYNVLRSEPERDYFKWSIGNKHIDDAYDVLTGASKTHSTREFDAVRFDTSINRRYTLPRGIRHLMLFPVASRQYTDNFYLTVQEEGQKLIIRFIVYGTVYHIQTDDNKNINIENACFMAENITVNNTLVSVLRPQYVRPGADAKNMNAIDWNKITLIPDTAVTNASRKYSGTLTAGYNNGILIIKGVLTPR